MFGAKERLEFYENILKKKVSENPNHFTDETPIEIGLYIHDSIKLSEESSKQLKDGKKEAFELINMPQKKHETSIIIERRINFNGLTNLIIFEGTDKKFAYA